LGVNLGQKCYNWKLGGAQMAWHATNKLKARKGLSQLATDRACETPGGARRDFAARQLIVISGNLLTVKTLPVAKHF
jgi:hypothetical protein